MTEPTTDDQPYAAPAPAAEPATGGDRRPRRLLLVVGVGRSGTSLCAGILSQLGFRVPQPEVASDETNPRGFSEPTWVVDFHRSLMRSRQIGVFDSRPTAWRLAAEAADDAAAYENLRAWLAVQFVGSDAVVVKDPRIGWFLDLWLRCARDLGLEASTVTMLRHPTEILSSARRSYGDWQSDASRATSWVNGMLGAELATRGVPRAFVLYDDLLSDWRAAITRAGSALDIPSLASLEPGAHPGVDAFVDPSLRRSPPGWAEHSVPGSVQELADRVWDRLTPLAAADPAPAAADPAPPAADTDLPAAGVGDPAAADTDLAAAGVGDPAAAGLDALREEYAAFYAEAEAIAQSSISAVKPAKKKAEAAPAAGSAAPSPPAPKGGAAARLVALAPASLRARVPVGVRRRLLALVGKGPRQAR